MTAPNPAHSLGAVMRHVARDLSATRPMTFADAFVKQRGPDLGYAAATLIRLEERGVAMQTAAGSYLFIRGPRWAEAAERYGWPEREEA